MPGKGALMEGVKDGRCGTKTAEHGSCGNIFAKCPTRQRMRSREVPRLGRKRKLLSELTAAVQEKASDFHSGAPDDVQATPRVRCRPPESSCAPRPAEMCTLRPGLDHRAAQGIVHISDRALRAQLRVEPRPPSRVDAPTDDFAGE